VVATFITSRAANPRQALLLASCFSLLGALTGGNAVADTVSSLIDLPAGEALLPVIFAALGGAIIWNIFTWYSGIPSSSTHSLVGAMIGAVWLSGGPENILWGWRAFTGAGHEMIGMVKIVIALLISPVIGFGAAFVLQKITKVLLINASSKINLTINRIQWIIISLLAYAHGANDSQKAAGLIVLALVSAGELQVSGSPLWVRMAVGFAIFTGTLIGGVPVMKTVGRKIYEVRPLHSLNSQLAAGGAILGATFSGAPVSTGHVIVGSVTGVGSADEYKMVKWRTGANIIVTWVVTIPASAIIAGLIYLFIRSFFPY